MLNFVVHTIFSFSPLCIKITLSYLFSVKLSAHVVVEQLHLDFSV